MWQHTGWTPFSDASPSYMDEYIAIDFMFPFLDPGACSRRLSHNDVLCVWQ
jgi:hypothetical protein